LYFYQVYTTYNSEAIKLQNRTMKNEKISVEPDEAGDGVVRGMPLVPEELPEEMFPVPVLALALLLLLLLELLFEELFELEIAEGETLVAAKPTWLVSLSKTMYKPRIKTSPRIV